MVKGKSYILGKWLLYYVALLQGCSESAIPSSPVIDNPIAINPEVVKQASNNQSAGWISDLVFMDLRRDKGEVQLAEINSNQTFLHCNLSVYTILDSPESSEESIQQVGFASEYQEKVARNISLDPSVETQQQEILGSDTLKAGEAINNLNEDGQKEHSKQISKRKREQESSEWLQGYGVHQKSENLTMQLAEKKEDQVYNKKQLKNKRRRRLVKLRSIKKQGGGERGVQLCQESGIMFEELNLYGGPFSVKSSSLELLDLPVELIENILSYLSYTSIMEVRQLSKFFYELTTGYCQPGLVGVSNKPERRVSMKSCALSKIIELEQIAAETIPSFVFYQFIRQVCNPPKEFWPYLQETNICKVILRNTKIKVVEIVNCIKHLQGTKVRMVSLSRNNLGAVIAQEVARYLQGTQVGTVDLGQNNIGEAGIGEFARNLQGTNVHTLYLYRNRIRVSEAIELARNLQGTNVHTLILFENRIGDIGVGEFARNLVRTNVQELDLSFNRLEDDEAAQLLKNLQGSLVRKINLSNNRLKAVNGEELAKSLNNTNIEDINLTFNDIRCAGALAFAKNLTSPKLKTINLKMNNIHPVTIRLIKKQYPHIIWNPE